MSVLGDSLTPAQRADVHRFLNTLTDDQYGEFWLYWDGRPIPMPPQEPTLGAWSGENIAASRWLGESDEQPQ